MRIREKARSAEAALDGRDHGLETRKRPDHDGEPLDEPVLPVLEDVDPLQLAVADVRLEEEDRRAAVVPLARVPEVLEDLRHDAEQGEHRVPSVVGLVDGGAAELDVLREQRAEPLDVAGFDRFANCHSRASSASLTRRSASSLCARFTCRYSTLPSCRAMRAASSDSSRSASFFTL